MAGLDKNIQILMLKGEKGDPGESANATWGAITGTLSNQTDLASALTAKANLASPTFTGTPIAPTATAGTSTTQIATTAFVMAAINNITDGDEVYY